MGGPTLRTVEQILGARICSPTAGIQLLKEVTACEVQKVKTLVLEGDFTGKADINVADRAGRRVMHIATLSIGNDIAAVDMIKLLAKMHADVNATDDLGEGPLHIAGRTGRAPLIRALIDLQANPGLSDVSGRTPLMHAVAM